MTNLLGIIFTTEVDWSIKNKQFYPIWTNVHWPKIFLISWALRGKKIDDSIA